MSQMNYRDQPEAIQALVQEDRVHRDLYLSEELFALEQERFFANTWQFAGHASQLPNVGDYVSLDIAGRPLVLVRDSDARIRAYYNRCAHKGARLVNEESGNTGKFFRCPYHAWTYKLNGQQLAIPFKEGYDGTRLGTCASGQELTAVADVVNYRDFVFVRLAPEGLSFQDYFGEVLQSLDNLADRSPEGRLVVAGGVLRNIIHCNWKMYLENINDAVHPMSTHESATKAAQAVWQGHGDDEIKPMAMEQILPFGSGYAFFDNMGGRVFDNGHSLLGVNFSIHSNYTQLPDYEAAMQAAHGVERTQDILQRSPQNAVLFPSLAVKGSPQVMRVIRPLSANRTLIEAWSFRVTGAPDLLFERAMHYNRLVFSPMSVVAHDDVRIFESIQNGLRANGNEWISLHRGFHSDELSQRTQTTNGTNEWLMRNQFRAWAKFMVPHPASAT